MSWAAQAQRAWHAQTTEELAHSWVVGIVERTSLDDLSGVALGWLGRQAPGLIADLLAELNSPHPGSGGLPASAAECARALTRLRDPERAAAEVPRDIAVLQVLVAEALGRNVAGEREGELGDRLAQLTHLFGELQGEFTQALLDQQLEADGRDPLTGLPGELAFQEELRRLVAVGQNEGTPFSVLELDLDGLRRVNVASGRGAGDRMLRAVADSAREQLGAGARLFRRAGDELGALVPGSVGPAATTLAARIRDAIGTLAEVTGVETSLSIGVASFPAHATEPVPLLERVREATYLAKASGQGVALAEVPVERP